MKIIQEPKVYLLGRQQMDEAAAKEFLADHQTEWITDAPSDAEKLCENAGRMCYMSFGARQGRKTNRDYLGHIIEVQHGSVLEHAVWNFIFTGISRSLTHELIRHRAGFGYSQLSQRYVDESTADFVKPDIIAEDAAASEVWDKAIGDVHDAYIKLVDLLAEKVEKSHPDLSKTERRKMARQAARSVLPNATETKIFVTANARALRHFIELRGSAAAETEIRKLAVALCRIMQKEAPNIFGDYRIVTLPDGTEGVETSYRKV